MPRRPLAWLPRISCGDACHKSRGSLGGTDYVVPVGTPVYAMFSGLARFRVAGTGGWTISINRDVDHQVGETMHMSRANGFILGGASRLVTEGDLIGWSGGAVRAPGAGSSTGPHLHAHVYVNGVRYGMEEYLHNPSWAGGGSIPIEIEEEEMNETKYYFKTAGGTTFGIFGATYPGGFEISTSERTGQAWGKLYGKPDGSPWAELDSIVWESLKAEAHVLNQRWVAQQRSIFGGGGVGDSGAVLTAISGVSAQVTGLTDQVSAFPAPPSPAAIAQAVNDDTAARLAQ